MSQLETLALSVTLHFLYIIITAQLERACVHTGPLKCGRVLAHYCMAGNFCGVLIFVIFMVTWQSRNFPTHEN